MLYWHLKRATQRKPHACSTAGCITVLKRWRLTKMTTIISAVRCIFTAWQRGIRIYKDLLRKCELEEKNRLEGIVWPAAYIKRIKGWGLAPHPLIVTRKTFGYADYPEISFRVAFPAETNQFRDKLYHWIFCAGEEPVKGLLIGFDGKQVSSGCLRQIFLTGWKMMLLV